MDEQFDIVPLLFEVFFVVFVHLRQFVCHFLGDVAGNLLDVVVGLQIAAADVQRDIRAVNHTVQQRQVFRHDVFDFVGHEYLVAIELNLVLLQLQRVESCCGGYPDST